MTAIEHLPRRKNDRFKSWIIAVLTIVNGVVSVSSITFAFKVQEAADMVHKEAALAKIQAGAAATSTIANRALGCFMMHQLKLGAHPLCEQFDVETFSPGGKNGVTGK